MAIDADILDAAFSRVQSYSTNLRISWPGVPFDPGDDGSWIEIRLLPNEPDNYSWDSEQQQYMGILQASVYYRERDKDRPETGIVSATNEADSLIAHFPKGTELGPVKVSRRPFIRPSIYNENQAAYFIPISIPYLGIA